MKTFIVALSLLFFIVFGVFAQTTLPYETVVAYGKTNLYDEPSLVGAEIDVVVQGDTVTIVEIDSCGWYKIAIKDKVGYVIPASIKTSDELETTRKTIVAEYYENQKKQQDRQKLLDEKQRKKDLIKKYGKTKGTLIAQGTVKLGFTAQMVIDAWGKPYDINRTVNSRGVSEQWIYGSDIQYRKYLYFDNGKLTSWQE